MDGMSILERYKQCMLVPSKDLEYNADGEALLCLFENDWIRILLIRNRHSEERSIIEVELSLPSEIIDGDVYDTHQLLEQALFYLEFMKQLCSKGFILQLVDRDWLWTASISVSDDIEELILKSLVLPI